MESLTNRTLAQQSIPPEFDLTKIVEFAVVLFSGLTGFIVWVNSYFKSKKENNQQFIETVVKATMDSCLKEFKDDFHEFRNKTEADMKEFNATVIMVLKEVRKP